MAEQTAGLKDKALQNFYETMIALHSEEGWRMFMEECARLRAHVTDINNVDETTTLDFRKGQRDILDWLLHQHEIIPAAYEELLKQDADEEVE